ncbi:MAG: hypothetical protein KDE01_27300, partial [Caldilineaceae bacterium]|nr:hypothetical protein [Caldilineaceae bacterium]
MMYLHDPLHQLGPALPRPRASHRPLPSFPTNHPLAGATHAVPLNNQARKRGHALHGDHHAAPQHDNPAPLTTPLVYTWAAT